MSKQDKMNEDSLKKGLSNLGEHENLADRLLRIDKDINKLKTQHWLNFFFFIIIVLIFMLLGAMLP